MWRFLENLFRHPGTWMLTSLLFVVVGIGAVPSIAAALAVCAAVAMMAALIALGFYLNRFRENWKQHRYTFGIQIEKLTFDDWASAHRPQAIAVAFAVVGLIVALTLTIGFFSGAATFAFMAPVFAGLASPFVAFSAASGIPVFPPAIAGFLFVLAPLVIFNNIKRFLSWVDSFKYDALTKLPRGDSESDITDNVKESHKANREEANQACATHGYLTILKLGAKATVNNRFSSPYRDAMERKDHLLPSTDSHDSHSEKRL